MKEWKYLSFGLKMQYFGIFGLAFENKYYHIWNQHPRICLIAKFCEKPKMPKFGTKNAYLSISGLHNVRAILSYLKSAPSNLSNCKILRKKTKKVRAKTWQVYCHTWNQDPRTCLIAKYREIIKMPKFGTKKCLICVFLG